MKAGGGGGYGPGPMAGPMTDQEPGEAAEAASIFLAKETLGGKSLKPGETITLTVKDVDPETGDVEAELSMGGGESEMESEGIASAFDRAMPEDEGEEMT